MGWFYTYGASRQDIIRELTEDHRDTTGFHTLAKFSNGFTQLYAVHEYRTAQGETKRFIGVYLLQRSSEGWGYKPMEEEMHPYFYGCPLKYLDMAPVACAEWREKVKAYWKHRAEKRQRRAVSV
jgi:hypothetical protein